jgi:flagellar motility protein MotE (MotC chaperone)
MIRLLQSSWIAGLVGSVSFLMVTAWSLRAPLSAIHPAQEDADDALGSAEASWNFNNPEVQQLISELIKEKDALALRAQQLNDFAARLQTERLELNQVTQHVFRLQQEFDRNVVRIREEETANLKKLAKVYAAMTPDNALAILKELGDDQVVKILAFMKENETAPILECMARAGDIEAKRAALISERLRLTIARPVATKGKTQ